MDLLLRRRMMMAQSTGGGGGGLPDNYQEVEYMEVERGAYVGEVGTIASGCEISMKLMMTSVDGSTDVLFATDTAVGYSLAVRPGGLYAVSIYRNGQLNSGFNSASNVFYDLTLADYTTIKDVDGNLLYSCSFNPSTWTSPIYFLAWGNTRGMKGRIWSFVVSNGGAEIISLVPCYDKGTNTPGFYDIIGGHFYTNQGTGSFTPGPNVY